MTVNTELAYAERAWTGAETSFAPGFPAMATADLRVRYRVPSGGISQLTLGVHFAATLAPGSRIATLTPLAMPAAPGMLLIGRRTSGLQPVDFQDNSRYGQDTHEEIADRAAMRDNELREAVDRALQPVDGLPEAVAAAQAAAAAAQAAGAAAELVAAEAIEAAEEAIAAAASITTDLWALQPLGTIVAIFDHIPGVTAPPKDKAYRYALLTAGLTGIGQYNEGVLGGESVSGSAPTISATAAITLTGSPLLGQSLRLINTERRFLRAGSAGTTEDSQNLAHNHGVNDPGHAHSHYIRGVQSNYGGGPSDSASTGLTTTTSFAATTGITIQNAGGTEARPRNIGATYYMRIK